MVNAAGPFHAAEIGIDGDGVEDMGSSTNFSRTPPRAI
jgi:hypothetical protein